MDDTNIRVADIGCDHGWLSIYLVEQGIASYAYACDVNQGPLDNAKANIKRFHLQDKIETILASGLSKLDKGSFDSVVIAGMGGTLIIELLEEDLGKLDDVTLYLQANVNTYGLRQFLFTHNFEIIDETLVKDNDIIYEIIKAKKTSNVIENSYSDIEMMFGRINLEKKSYLICELLLQKLEKLSKIIELMPFDLEKRQVLEKQAEDIKEYLTKNSIK